MRFPKTAARQRRLAVLRQLASRDGEDSLESAEIIPVERSEDGDEFISACGAKLPLRLSITDERSGESEDVLVERPWALIGGDNANPSARVGIQKRVTKNFTFTFSTDVTQPQSEIVQGEYQLTKRWSVSVVRDQSGGFSMDGRFHTNF